MATGKRVADVAEQVVAAKRQGLKTISIGLVTWDLTEFGMCARFVRECHEAALQHSEQTWPYRGLRALEVNEKLRAAGLTVRDRARGDVICFSGGEFGHVVIWLGGGMVAENTISGKRGTPRVKGHKISALADIGESRIIGWYRPLPLPEVKPPDDGLALAPWEVAARSWAMSLGLTDGKRPCEPMTRVEVWETLRRLQHETHPP